MYLIRCNLKKELNINRNFSLIVELGLFSYWQKTNKKIKLIKTVTIEPDPN